MNFETIKKVNTKTIVAVAIILVVLGASQALARPGNITWNGDNWSGSGMMGYYYKGTTAGYGCNWPGIGMMGYGMVGMGILGLIFSILVFIGLVLLIKYLWEGGGAKREQGSTLEILKKRYARGEINKEEFEEKKRDLV
jgi:putative membrane protein